MRILYHISELDIGGAERMLYALTTGLAQRGHEIEVACLTGHGEVGEWLADKGINVHYLEASVYRPHRIVFPLRRIIRNFSPNVLHNFLFHANMVGRLVGWSSSVPAVVCAVRVEDVERKWRLWIDGATHWMMHRQTCVSESAARFTQEASGIPMAKLVAIPNCVEVSNFNAAKGMLRKELGINDSTPLLLTVGRLSRQKGLPYLLEALKIVHEELGQVMLAVVGAGEDEESLRSQTGMLGLADSVEFLGWRSEIPEFLADADIFVLASLWEGMPNVVLEAMASARPVVGTRVGGTAELIQDNETGLLVPPQDAHALARAILQLLGDDKLRNQMGTAGRRRATEEFSPERMISRNEKLYEDLLMLGK